MLEWKTFEEKIKKLCLIDNLKKKKTDTWVISRKPYSNWHTFSYMSNYCTYVISKIKEQIIIIIIIIIVIIVIIINLTAVIVS